MDITRWSILKSDWLYSLQPKMGKLYTVSKNKTKSWLWLRSWTPHAKLRLEQSRETTRSSRYDLNQIPYNYTMEVTNRFKILDLIECLKNYGWRFMTLYRKQWLRKIIKKDHPQEKERQNGCLRKTLQVAEKRREAKGKGEKARYTHLNAELQRIARRDKRTFLSDQCKEIEGKSRMGKTRELFKKIRVQGNISCKDSHNKGQKWYANRSRRY